jgi:aldose sugar dehydrogenase
MTMKTPTALVTAALVAAILVAASFLIAAGTRGEELPAPFTTIRER